MGKKKRRQFDQSHLVADRNALAAVRDVVKMLVGTEDPYDQKIRRAKKILTSLHIERSTDPETAFVLEDAMEIMLRPPGR